MQKPYSRMFRSGKRACRRFQMAVAQKPFSETVGSGHGAGAAVEQGGAQSDAVHGVPFGQNVGWHGGEGHVGHVEIGTGGTVAGQHFHGARFLGFVEAARPPHGQKGVVPCEIGRHEVAVGGKRAAEMAGNQVLKPVLHAVAAPGAEAQPVGKRESRPAAETEIAAPLPHETAYRLGSGRSESIGLAPRGTSGHYEHLARQTGLGYV